LLELVAYLQWQGCAKAVIVRPYDGEYLLVGSMRSRTHKFIAGGAAAGIVLYIMSVGAGTAVSRHIEDGRLQWMRSSSLVSIVLDIYEWPAHQAAVLPPARWLFEFSAAFWCGITDAPETTG
jgi:hypothetical protein